LRVLKRSAAVFGLFILLVGLILLGKGILAGDKLLYFRKIPRIWMERLPLFSSASSDKEEIDRQEEIILALKEIQKQREELRAKEEKLRKLEERLSAQKEELKREGEKLLALKNKLEELTGQERTRQSERVSWLASVYGQMRPEEAAPIIEKLNEDLAISILSQMEEREASKILGAMEDTRAAQLSEKIGKDIVKQILEEVE